MATSTSSAVPFVQGQDVVRLRAVVVRSTKEVKDYAAEYEDLRAIVEALSTEEQADPVNKSKLDILGVRERRLEAARDRETAAMSNLINYLIADNSARHKNLRQSQRRFRQSPLLILCRLQRRRRRS